MINIRKSIFAAVVLTASNTSFANDKWDNSDKALFATYTVVRAADMAQTINIARNPDRFHEMNPLLGRHPSEQKVIGFFIISHALIWLAADYMPPKARKLFLTGGIAIEAGFVANNSRLGIKVSF